MKILSVRGNNKRRAFEVVTDDRSFSMPYCTVDPAPSKSDPISEVYVDPELGNEGFTFRLRSGAEGSVHMDSVLEYNEDPAYLRDILLHRLTVEAQRRVAESPLSQREIMRRIGTSPSQFYRLLDTTNTSKSVDGLVILLAALDCTVDFTVHSRAVHGR
jgi:hypothetical protein